MESEGCCLMPFVEPREIPQKPWGRETVLVDGPGYQLKRLIYEAGHQGALQLHPERDEAFTLVEGGAEVSWIEIPPFTSDSAPAPHLLTYRMMPGQTFHVPPGTPHKFHAITRCVVYEASNGKLPASVNVAEQYGDEDGQAR